MDSYFFISWDYHHGFWAVLFLYSSQLLTDAILPQFKNTGKHSEVFVQRKLSEKFPVIRSKYWNLAKLKFVSSKKTWVSHLIYMMMYMTWWPTGLMIVTESLSFINIRLWYIIYRLVPSKQLRHYWVRSPEIEDENRWKY